MSQDIITFGTGKLYATPTFDFAGNALANAQPVVFSQLQDVSSTFEFDEKLLHGRGQFPIGVGRGMGKITGNAKSAAVNALMYGNLFFGQSPQAGIRSASEDNIAVVPAAGPYTIVVAPPATGTFVADLAVFNALTGAPMVKTASAPAAGQYMVTVTAGVATYTFAAADASLPVSYNFEYSATSLTASYIQLTNKQMGYMPFFSANLVSSYAGQSITLKLNKCASNKFSLPHKNDDFSVPDFDFSAFADSAGNIGYIAFSQ